jgi:hypothetical protein
VAALNVAKSCGSAVAMDSLRESVLDMSRFDLVYLCELDAFLCDNSTVNKYHENVLDHMDEIWAPYFSSAVMEGLVPRPRLSSCMTNIGLI